MKLTAIFLAIIFIFGVAFIPEYSEAARMGGGRSFGSRPHMSTPAQAPSRTSQTRQPGAVSPQTSPAKGMLGGLAGGLLAGTLLGSLLGGNGFGGGGFMDLILLAVLAFIGYKLFQRFKSRQASSSASPGSPYGNTQYNQTTPFNQNSQQYQDTSNAGGWGAFASNPNSGFQADPNIDIPAGFNVDEFLKGAKMAYTRLQKSWDRRDLADIAQFATPAVMKVLEQQLQDDPNPGNTEILLVNAQLTGVEQEGNEQRAQVYFDVLMRESPNQQQPENVREIWHFVREDQNGMWKLDGIQQAE